MRLVEGSSIDGVQPQQVRLDMDCYVHKALKIERTLATKALVHNAYRYITENQMLADVAQD